VNPGKQERGGAQNKSKNRRVFFSRYLAANDARSKAPHTLTVNSNPYPRTFLYKLLQQRSETALGNTQNALRGAERSFTWVEAYRCPAVTSKRYGSIHFAQLPQRGLTQSFVVLIIGNSRVEFTSAHRAPFTPPCPLLQPPPPPTCSTLRCGLR